MSFRCGFKFWGVNCKGGRILISRRGRCKTIKVTPQRKKDGAPNETPSTSHQPTVAITRGFFKVSDFVNALENDPYWKKMEQLCEKNEANTVKSAAGATKNATENMQETLDLRERFDCFLRTELNRMGIKSSDPNASATTECQQDDVASGGISNRRSCMSRNPIENKRNLCTYRDDDDNVYDDRDKKNRPSVENSLITRKLPEKRDKRIYPIPVHAPFPEPSQVKWPFMDTSSRIPKTTDSTLIKLKPQLSSAKVNRRDKPTQGKTKKRPRPEILSITEDHYPKEVVEQYLQTPDDAHSFKKAIQNTKSVTKETKNSQRPETLFITEEDYPREVIEQYLQQPDKAESVKKAIQKNNTKSVTKETSKTVHNPSPELPNPKPSGSKKQLIPAKVSTVFDAEINETLYLTPADIGRSRVIVEGVFAKGTDETDKNSNTKSPTNPENQEKSFITRKLRNMTAVETNPLPDTPEQQTPTSKVETMTEFDLNNFSETKPLMPRNDDDNTELLLRISAQSDNFLDVLKHTKKEPPQAKKDNPTSSSQQPEGNGNGPPKEMSGAKNIIITKNKRSLSYWKRIASLFIEKIQKTEDKLNPETKPVVKNKGENRKKVPKSKATYPPPTDYYAANAADFAHNEKMIRALMNKKFSPKDLEYMYDCIYTTTRDLDTLKTDLSYSEDSIILLPPPNAPATIHDRYRPKVSEAVKGEDSTKMWKKVIEEFNQELPTKPIPQSLSSPTIDTEIRIKSSSSMIESAKINENESGKNQILQHRTPLPVARIQETEEIISTMLHSDMEVAPEPKQLPQTPVAKPISSQVNTNEITVPPLYLCMAYELIPVPMPPTRPAVSPKHPSYILKEDHDEDVFITPEMMRDKHLPDSPAAIEGIQHVAENLKQKRLKRPPLFCNTKPARLKSNIRNTPSVTMKSFPIVREIESCDKYLSYLWKSFEGLTKKPPQPPMKIEKRNRRYKFKNVRSSDTPSKPSVPKSMSSQQSVNSQTSESAEHSIMAMLNLLPEPTNTTPKSNTPHKSSSAKQKFTKVEEKAIKVDSFIHKMAWLFSKRDVTGKKQRSGGVDEISHHNDILKPDQPHVKTYSLPDEHRKSTKKQNPQSQSLTALSKADDDMTSGPSNVIENTCTQLLINTTYKVIAIPDDEITSLSIPATTEPPIETNMLKASAAKPETAFNIHKNSELNFAKESESFPNPPTDLNDSTMSACSESLRQSVADILITSTIKQNEPTVKNPPSGCVTVAENVLPDTTLHKPIVDFPFITWEELVKSVVLSESTLKSQPLIRKRNHKPRVKIVKKNILKRLVVKTNPSITQITPVLNSSATNTSTSTPTESTLLNKYDKTIPLQSPSKSMGSPGEMSKQHYHTGRRTACLETTNSNKERDAAGQAKITSYLFSLNDSIDQSTTSTKTTGRNADVATKSMQSALQYISWSDLVTAMKSGKHLMAEHQDFLMRCASKKKFNDRLDEFDTNRHNIRSQFHKASGIPVPNCDDASKGNTLKPAQHCQQSETTTGGKPVLDESSIPTPPSVSERRKQSSGENEMHINTLIDLIISTVHEMEQKPGHITKPNKKPPIDTILDNSSPLDVNSNKPVHEDAQLLNTHNDLTKVITDEIIQSKQFNQDIIPKNGTEMIANHAIDQVSMPLMKNAIHQQSPFPYVSWNDLVQMTKCKREEVASEAQQIVLNREVVSPTPAMQVTSDNTNNSMQNMINAFVTMFRKSMPMAAAKKDSRNVDNDQRDFDPQCEKILQTKNEKNGDKKENAHKN